MKKKKNPYISKSHYVQKIFCTSISGQEMVTGIRFTLLPEIINKMDRIHVIMVLKTEWMRHWVEYSEGFSQNSRE